ncbi:hypothetical protein CC85DRAFT_310108 [Cutaneotrichosporon oleaginosum]|uniref:PHD-type domain-containing protein n=1 Tax=Cutaneotrichosporon oleaginosum TaxID=879819 RepID=A0A0J0XYF3_9TREE|nr:uncharacterized protein CC85DRAFT_310108 [Cutaneotrichosporon oleaginosum]KLT46080.1 hypothetical protein CC85DRAFT_310108 [Cutaneotrichosporon oleaginosum]TXT10093.1 hypothetical protein COLE_04027 [Cutaneotrichosporon oleaginosum]
MEARRRQASASTSTSYSHDDAKTPGKGSGGVTPSLEGDDDAAPRRTRNRNPLPPQVGPLFPPLPPRPAKNSPKNSPKTASRSPSGKFQRLASASALSSVMGDDSPENATADDMGAGRDAHPASASSLSPPPPVDDDMLVDSSAQQKNEGNGDDWDAYHRRRGVRSFSGAKSGAVKVEPIEAEPVPEEHAAESEAAAEVEAEATENGQDVEMGGEAEGAAEGDDEVGGEGEADAAEANVSNGNAEADGDERSRKETSAATSAEPPHRNPRKRRGEEQLLLDDHLLPKEMRQHAPIPPRRDKSVKRSEPEEAPPKEEPAELEEAETEEVEVEEVGDDADDGDDSGEITRCVCKREEDIDVMMIQCDKCNVWQHGACVGIWGDDEAPDEYFCEECKPELHGPLKKWMRHCGRNPANFVPPEPEDLLKLYHATDKHPPSQSKRWATELPPQPKPPSRSHRKKEDDDDRRSSRKSVAAEKTARPPSSKDAARDRRRGRRQSTDLSLSGSPPRHEPKKRSTMNSRDAAYEEAVKAALEASRREASGEKEEQPAVEERKRRRPDNDEGEQQEAKKGKKKEKKDEEDGETTPAPAPKPKHPNQYTYRPKGDRSAAAASPMRARGTPQPTGPPPAHDHGTRRAGAIANNLASQPYSAMTVHNLNWYLPDHLLPCADILETPTPVPLEVPSPRTLQYLPRTHFTNQRYGPFTDERDEEGRLILPDDMPLREVEGEAVNHREPPTRVRYPVKRITTAEMRKRVRNLLEYVGRVQDEEARRAERAAKIGIPPTSAPRPRLPPLGEDGREGSQPNGEAAERPSVQPLPPGPPPPTASQLLDEFTRDLISFQEAFNTGDFESLPFAQPRPQPPTPEPEPTPELEPTPEPGDLREHGVMAEHELDMDAAPETDAVVAMSEQTVVIEEGMVEESADVEDIKAEPPQEVSVDETEAAPEVPSARGPAAELTEPMVEEPLEMSSQSPVQPSVAEEVTVDEPVLDAEAMDVDEPPAALAAEIVTAPAEATLATAVVEDDAMEVDMDIDSSAGSIPPPAVHTANPAALPTEAEFALPEPSASEVAPNVTVAAAPAKHSSQTAAEPAAPPTETFSEPLAPTPVSEIPDSLSADLKVPLVMGRPESENSEVEERERESIATEVVAS